MAKVTIATVKSFIKKNRISLLISQKSDFDSSVDGVRNCADTGFSPALDADNKISNNFGIAGVWFVGGSRDYCSVYDQDGIKGFSVYNSCGSFVLGVKA